MASIYIGLLFLSIAVAVKFYPGLLAGYNSMSNRDKENAQSNGLPTFASIVFGVMGVISIGGYLASIWLDRPSLSNISILMTIVGMIVIVVFGNLLINRQSR